jgi:hypothetical protein
MRVYRRHSVNSRAVHHFEDLAGKLLEVSKTEFDERRNGGETGGPHRLGARAGLGRAAMGYQVVLVVRTAVNAPADEKMMRQPVNPRMAVQRSEWP